MSSVRPTPKLRAYAVSLGAFALTGALAIGAVSIGHAESQVELAANYEAPADNAQPSFTPSDEAQFTEAFAPYDTPASPTAQNGAVDITTITPASPPPEPEPQSRSLGRGVASYYGRRFHGRLTANGERFNMNAMTAAHKTLPFGTRLRVTNRANGRAVIVRVNDRGPFIRGRDIDLARAAAEKIGLIARGHGNVDLEIIED